MSDWNALLAASGLPRLEARALLEHVSARSRSWLIAHGDEAAPAEAATRFAALARRRREGEPLAYLLGFREFHGLRLRVSPAVLIPRADTELLVDLAIRLAPDGARALDLGTGPGVIALVLARLGFNVTGLDLSEEMLAKARANAQRAGMDITFLNGDAESPPFPDGSFDLIACRHIMWTLPDLPRAVAKWHALLKPGGAVVIIDGLWYPDTLQGRVRRLLGYCLETVKSGKWPGGWQRKYVGDQSALPYINGAPLSAVEDVVRSAGFARVDHDHLEELRAYELKHSPLEYRIHYAHCPRYLVAGVKAA